MASGQKKGIKILLLRIDEQELELCLEKVCLNLKALQTMKANEFEYKKVDTIVLTCSKVQLLLRSIKNLIDENSVLLVELGLNPIADEIEQLSPLIAQINEDIAFLVKVLDRMVLHKKGLDLVVYESASLYTLIDSYRVIQDNVKQTLERVCK